MMRAFEVPGFRSVFFLDGYRVKFYPVEKWKQEADFSESDMKSEIQIRNPKSPKYTNITPNCPGKAIKRMLPV